MFVTNGSFFFFFFYPTDRLQKKTLVKNPPFKESTDCGLMEQKNDLDQMSVAMGLKPDRSSSLPRIPRKDSNSKRARTTSTPRQLLAYPDYESPEFNPPPKRSRNDSPSSQDSLSSADMRHVLNRSRQTTPSPAARDRIHHTPHRGNQIEIARQAATDIIDDVKSQLQRNGEFEKFDLFNPDPASDQVVPEWEEAAQTRSRKYVCPSPKKFPKSLHDTTFDLAENVPSFDLPADTHVGQVSKPIRAQPYMWGPQQVNHETKSHVVHPATVARPSQTIQYFAGLEEDTLLMADHLDKTIITKIQNLEFVEFASLLPPEVPELDKNKKKVVWDNESVSFVQETQEKSLNNYTIWSKAFRIYMAVMIAKYPELTHQLMTYQSQIQLASQMQSKFKLQGWRQYDWVMRKKFAKYPHLRWDVKDEEHWNRYVVMPLASASFNSAQGTPSKSENTPTKNKGRYNSPKPCRDFNKPDGCPRSNCKFSHVCSYCQKRRHTISECRVRMADKRKNTSTKHNNQGGDKKSE